MVQRQAEEEEEEIIQTKEASGCAPEVAPDIESDISSLSGGGQPLPESVRTFFEPRFGYDFSGVKVHSDPRAAESACSISARAFTLGSDVVFGEGQYKPETSEGRRLLAHELTHVVQQNSRLQSVAPMTSSIKISEPGDRLEREADHVADQMAFGTDKVKRNLAVLSPSIQRTCGQSAIIAIAPPSCSIGDHTFVPGTLFKFNKDCDDFAPGQQAALISFASALPPAATLEIHSYASADAATFNEQLSCARSSKAQSVLTASPPSGAGIAASRITSIVNHGPTPGPAAERRSVVIRTSTPTPTPLTPTPTPTPVQPVPTILVPACPCPAAGSCPPTYCMSMPRIIAEADRFAKAPALISVLTALGGAGVGAIYNQFVWGGRSGVMTLSSSLRNEFATICQTSVATNYIMTAIINAIWGRYPASTPAQTIPLSAIAPTAVSDIDTPGNAHELVYCGATNAPGLLAGGVGKTQLTTLVGAIPSSQNDSRTATGQIDVSRHSLPGGGIRLVFTPTVDIEVRDTVDFCPGNCGGLAAQVATVPFSMWEASGISGDVPFVTQFAAPQSQLRKIVLQSVNGVDQWSLEPV